jgi:hypothetical protein
MVQLPKADTIARLQFFGPQFPRKGADKKKERWIKRLEKLPMLERMALLSAIDDVFSDQ